MGGQARIGFGGGRRGGGPWCIHGVRRVSYKRGSAFFDPLPGRAQALAARIAASAQPDTHVVAVNSNDPRGFDVMVNASPLGLKLSDAMPCDVARMEPHAALVDILMKNQPTPAVRAARARGLVAHADFELMIQQTHLYLDFFGFTEAVQQVRSDSGSICNMIRNLIDPGTQNFSATAL